MRRSSASDTCAARVPTDAHITLFEPVATATLRVESTAGDPVIGLISLNDLGPGGNITVVGTPTFVPLGTFGFPPP